MYKDPHDPRLKAKRDEWYKNNKDQHRVGVKASRQRRVDLVNERKNVPCMDCGQRYPSYVMEFDHRDPTTKAGNVSQMVGATSLQRLLDEMDKCDVVCSNCHRIRTHGAFV